MISLGSSFCQKGSLSIDARILYEARPDALLEIFDLALIETLKNEKGFLVGDKKITCSRSYSVQDLAKVLPHSSIQDYSGGVFIYSYTSTQPPVKFIVRHDDQLYVFLTSIRAYGIPRKATEVRECITTIEKYIAYFSEGAKKSFEVHLIWVVFREFEEMGMSLHDIEDEYKVYYADTKVAHYKQLKTANGEPLKLQFFDD